MEPTPELLKTSMRAAVRARVAALPLKLRQQASDRAVALLLEQNSWRCAGSVLLYYPISGELDVWPLAQQALQAGKTVALPRFMAETNQYDACEVKDPAVDLRPGRYGIPEPLERCGRLLLNQLDFVLVPGVAFDLHGRRLGRGKGYYDRLLARLRGKTCGVAFDEQIVPEVPIQPHDSGMNCILTPTRWVEL